MKERMLLFGRLSRIRDRLMGNMGRGWGDLPLSYLALSTSSILNISSSSVISDAILKTLRRHRRMRKVG
jgi:hypothetical protein